MQMCVCVNMYVYYRPFGPRDALWACQVNMCVYHAYEYSNVCVCVNIYVYYRPCGPGVALWACQEIVTDARKIGQVRVVSHVICLICIPYMHALYACLICMPYMHALYACLICMPCVMTCELVLSRNCPNTVLHQHALFVYI